MINYIELTRSKLRRKLLGFFFTNPESTFYVREIAAIINADPGNLSKELTKLEKEGIFVVNVRGNQKLFSLNKRYPLFDEIKSIIFKTIGVKGALEKSLGNVSGIQFAFLYGSYARSKEHALSDIDLMMIVNIDKFKESGILGELRNLEKDFSREINYTYYPVAEWIDKINTKDSFIANILEQPIIMIKGNKDELQRLGKPGQA